MDFKEKNHQFNLLNQQKQSLEGQQVELIANINELVELVA